MDHREAVPAAGFEQQDRGVRFFGESADNSERAALVALVRVLQSLQPAARVVAGVVGAEATGALSIPPLGRRE